jgi:hypothetical protein
MLSRRLRLYLTAALTLTLGSAACDRPSNITDPVNNSAFAPQFSNNDRWKTVNVTVTEGDEAEAVIDQKGGVISLRSGAAVLVVPKNAVKGKVTFHLTLHTGSQVMVSATATSKDGVLNDVGAAGFKTDLTLYMSKFGARATDKTRKLIIGEKVGDVVVPVETTDLGSYLSAKLRHFSDYCMGEA